jgi:hypothetical protein
MPPIAKAFGDQPIARLNHVMVSVMWKFPLEPVGGLARSATPDRVRHDDEVVCRIERLAGRKQLVGEARTQPIRAGASIALQKQHPVDDPSCCVALCRPKGAVMELQFG